MSSTEKTTHPALLVSKQENCLRELKNAGATPVQMIWYGLLNFTMPAMFRALMVAVGIVGSAFLTWMMTK